MGSQHPGVMLRKVRLHCLRRLSVWVLTHWSAAIPCLDRVRTTQSYHDVRVSRTTVTMSKHQAELKEARPRMSISLDTFSFGTVTSKTRQNRSNSRVTFRDDPQSIEDLTDFSSDFPTDFATAFATSEENGYLRYGGASSIIYVSLS